MLQKRRWAWDIETNGLLDESTIDYTASPYKLRDDYRIHCAVFEDIDSDDVVEFVQDEVYTKMPQWISENCNELIGNNTISFDHLAIKLAVGIDYTVCPDTVGGLPVTITDNMVLSKVLNPDRLGHSVEYFGRILGGEEKIDWRSKAVELGLINSSDPKGAEFAVYHPEMLVYNRRDTNLSKRIYKYLMQEWGDWDWSDAYNLEKAVRELITRQEHYGFYFHTDKAIEYVKELDRLLEERRVIVEPVLPTKVLAKTNQKQYIPPSSQFLKSGKPNAHITNFASKHGGEVYQVGEEWWINVLGVKQALPLPTEPLVTTCPAEIKDSTHIKEWLVSLGWTPTDYKERDLTCDAKKKKVSQEKYVAAVEKYVEQTLNSSFCKDRLAHLETTREKFRDKLLKHDITKPMKVLTNPVFTVGQEKDLCPHLAKVTEKFPHAKLVVEYMTYSHRRNSILGGKQDPDMEDDEEYDDKGWLGNPRVAIDNRISTPADTCGAGTSRFKHRKVANVPRTTSLFGKQMRSLFGTDTRQCYQLAFDFDSLEAKIEAHYVYRYEGGIEYGKSLTAEKPNDCHSVLARKISEMIGAPFPRATAKSVKYGCSYNAQPKRVTKIVGCDLRTATLVFDGFWQNASCLKSLKEAMQNYWETKGGKKFIPAIDKRKLPIRSKGNVINTAFQSAGVICAKRAMVMQDRRLKAEGFIVDIFTQDWRNNKHFVQQMIAYHDEAQFAITKELVKWKMFSSEEDAKAFKAENPNWSDIGHNEKGWYVGWCRAGEILVECVKAAGEYYNLNVELTAGYMLGIDWATCH